MIENEKPMILGPGEAALFLGVGATHVGRLARQGKLRNFRSGRIMSFSLDDLRTFARARAEQRKVDGRGRPTTREAFEKRLRLAAQSKGT